MKGDHGEPHVPPLGLSVYFKEDPHMMKLALAVAIGSQKKWPAQLHLQCQVNSAHGAGKPDVC